MKLFASATVPRVAVTWDTPGSHKLLTFLAETGAATRRDRPGDAHAANGVPVLVLDGHLQRQSERLAHGSSLGVSAGRAAAASPRGAVAVAVKFAEVSPGESAWSRLGPGGGAKGRGSSRSCRPRRWWSSRTKASRPR